MRKTGISARQSVDETVAVSHFVVLLHNKALSPLMCWGDQRSDLHRLGSVGVAVTMVPSIIGCASDFWLSTEASDQHLGLWKLSDHSQSLEGAVVGTRGLVSLALCLHCSSVLTGLCCSHVHTRELFKFSFLPRLEEITALLAAGLMAASVAIFSEWSRTLPVVVGLSFGWSFYLYFSATCSLLLFGGLVAIARDRAMFDDLKQTKEITLL